MDSETQMAASRHPQQTTAYPGTFIGGVAGSKPDSLVPPLAKALDNHASQLEKLGGVVGILEERLTSVRNQASQAAGKTEIDRIPASPVVERVGNLTSIVHNLQARINNLIEELEV